MEKIDIPVKISGFESEEDLDEFRRIFLEEAKKAGIKIEEKDGVVKVG